MVAIVALKNSQARQFYAQHAAQDAWSVRELNHQIERKAFERTELASLQATLTVQAEPAVAHSTTPALVNHLFCTVEFLTDCAGCTG